jgi:thioester reductase-like protein
VPDTEIWLLIRAESDLAMQERLKELTRFWDWDNDPDKTARIHGLTGDAARPFFNLEKSRYEELARRCTHIIHCAGTVRMNLEIEDARRSAVGSTEQILALARTVVREGRLAKVDFVSTVGVAGKRSGTLPESWLDEMPAFHNTYEQAKAEAEIIIRLAVENERLPITVHRPSMVIGNSRDGRVVHFQIFYFLCEFLSGRKTLGLYPHFSRVQLDIIPSDTVAAAIVAASQDSATIGKIFHLCSGSLLAPLIEEVKTTVRNAFASHGIPVPPAINLPMRWYAALARLASHFAPASQRKALATLPIYLDYLADRQTFGNSSFTEWSAAHGPTLPRWQEYLPRVLDYYLEQRNRTEAPR